MDLNILSALIVATAGAGFKFYQESKRHKEVINLQKQQHEQVLAKAKEKDDIDRLQLDKLDSIKVDLAKALDSVIVKNKKDADLIKKWAFSFQGREFVDKFFLLYKQNHLEDEAMRLEDIKNTLRSLLEETDTDLRSLHNMEHYLVDRNSFIVAVLNAPVIEQIYKLLVQSKQREKTNTMLEAARLMEQLENELCRLYMYWVEKMKQTFPI